LIRVRTHFDDSVRESTTLTMKKEAPAPTLDYLSEEDRKALEAYHKEVDELFFSHYEVTQQGLIQKDAVSINISKAKVTPEVWSNPSLSLDDVQVMINSTLERQAKSSDELICRLIEERDWRRHVDSNVQISSCANNFAKNQSSTKWHIGERHITAKSISPADEPFLQLNHH
jgi:hypothetical protein